jgi:hypothetical protein
MKYNKFLSAALLTLSIDLFAGTSASTYALYKQSISPAMSWADNGILTVPKANTIGRNNINFGITSIDSGSINNQKLYLTSATLMLGTSEDVELGYTKKTFIWEDGERSDINMDTIHLKARLLHITDYYTPQIAFGINGASLSGGKVTNATKEEFLFNPYIAITIPIRVFTDNFIMTFTAVAENIMSEGDSTETFFSGGMDLQIYRDFYLMAEAHGLNTDDGEPPIVNIGFKYRYGWMSLGAGLFNISEDKLKEKKVNASENKEQYWMLHANITIPMGKIVKDLFPDEKKKPEPKFSERDMINQLGGRR